MKILVSVVLNILGFVIFHYGVELLSRKISFNLSTIWGAHKHSSLNVIIKQVIYDSKTYYRKYYRLFYQLFLCSPCDTVPPLDFQEITGNRVYDRF